MTYNPLDYWTAAGADPENSEHEIHFRRSDVFARQEAALMAVLEGLEFRSILEVGCGWGRITKLVHERWPKVPYTAFDLSPERVTSARQKAPGVEFHTSTVQDFGTWQTFDLVLTTEMLMHIVPADIEEVVAKLLALSSRYVVSLDWAVPLLGVQIADWNFLHDYPSLYGSALRSVRRTDLQAVYLAEPLHSDGPSV